MQEVKPKWLERGLVLVCERCSAERIPEEDPDIAARIAGFNLRDWLKERLKADGRWGAIRALSTSCMDVCARGRVTVCIDSCDGRAPEVLVIDPIGEKQTVYDRIVAQLAVVDK